MFYPYKQITVECVVVKKVPVPKDFLRNNDLCYTVTGGSSRLKVISVAVK